MFRLFSFVMAIAFGTSGAFAQTVQNGKGKTCTSVNKQCYARGGNQGICEPKLQSCLQSGTYPGNNFIIQNLEKR